MIYLCFAAGLRVSELVGLCLEQFELNPQPAIHVIGKGRKERILPLWKETATVLKAWIAVRPNEKTTPSEIFLYSQGLAVTRSGFEYILSKHVKKTIKSIAIASKKTNFASRFTPFLRNTDT
jgi:integrase/recombinase XerD